MKRTVIRAVLALGAAGSIAAAVAPAVATAAPAVSVVAAAPASWYHG